MTKKPNQRPIDEHCKWCKKIFNKIHTRLYCSQNCRSAATKQRLAKRYFSDYTYITVINTGTDYIDYKDNHDAIIQRYGIIKPTPRPSKKGITVIIPDSTYTTSKTSRKLDEYLQTMELTRMGWQ